jgi:predicted secreted protein
VARGGVANATTGFSWEVNGTEIANIDSEFMTLPSGTTANQPSAVDAMVRYDTTTDKLRAVENGVWKDVIQPLQRYEFFADQVDYPFGS